MRQVRGDESLPSGLLRCGVCDARFTLTDERAYAWATYVNGAACTNRLRVARTLVEAKVLETVKADLRDPELIAQVERCFRRALASRGKPKADVGKRVGGIAVGDREPRGRDRGWTPQIIPATCAEAGGGRS